MYFLLLYIGKLPRPGNFAFALRLQAVLRGQRLGEGGDGSFTALFQFHFHFREGKLFPAAQQNALVQCQFHGTAGNFQQSCQTQEFGAAGGDNQFIEYLNSKGIMTAHGKFGADMQVEISNDGPVTILLDSSKIL